MTHAATIARLALVSPVILTAVAMRLTTYAWARASQAALVAAGICTWEDFRCQ